MNLPLPSMTVPIRERFWAKVERRADDECWPWKGALQRNGYGSFRIGSHTYQAHRVAYFLTTADDPGELDVLHTCDVRHCCNPRDVFLGTNDDNVADRVAKGRSNTSPLTAADVHSIRRLSGVETQRKIAADFGVTQGTVSNIVNQKTRKTIANRARDRSAAEFTLNTAGALSLRTLLSMGFKEGHLRRWVKSGALYHPYTDRADIFMVKR